MSESCSVTDDIAVEPPSDAFPQLGQYVGDPEVRAEWDSRYADQTQLWSGRPNGALVAEVAGLTPGRVLDVGCGEGADAVWLARGGWDVTGLEVSGLALERAASHARDAGVTIHWVHAGLAEAALPPASFDLVSAQYPALLRTPDAAAERALLAAVAPAACCCLSITPGWTRRRCTTTASTPQTTSGRPWSLHCSTTPGRSSWTSSVRGSHQMAGPALTTRMTSSCVPVGGAETEDRRDVTAAAAR